MICGFVMEIFRSVANSCLKNILVVESDGYFARLLKVIKVTLYLKASSFPSEF